MRKPNNQKIKEKVRKKKKKSRRKTQHTKRVAGRN